MELVRQKNVATYIVVPIVDADGDPVTAAAALDSEIDTWSDGAAPDGFADCTNEATEIGIDGIYYLSLTQAEMNNDYIYIQIKTSTSGAKTQHILIRTIVGDPLNTATTGDGGTINVTGGAIDTVTTVTTTTTNTDMVGTNGALLAANINIAAGVVEANLIQMGGVVQSATDLKDFADAGYDPATNKVQGVVLVDTVTTLTGHTAQTADHTANIAAILTDTGTTLDDHLTDIKGTGFVKDTHSLIDIETYVDLIDDGTSGLAKIATDVATVLVDTTEIGAAGAGLTALPWNAVWDAEVQSEVNDALVAQKLDHLVAVADADDVVDDSIIAKLADSGATADWSNYVNTTDSLRAIRDRGDSAWITGAGGSDRLLMVDTTIATLASQTSFTLTAGSADNDAYNNCTIIIEDAAVATQKAVGMVLDYTGATKTVTLKEVLAFTIAPTDKVYILAENALKSTVANRQLDVTATGAAGINWGNIENKTSVNDLSATDIQLCDTVTALTGHTAQTGDSFAIVNSGTYGNAQLVRSTTPANTLDVNATGEAGIDLDNISGTLAKTTDITGFNDLSAAQINAEVDTAISDVNLDHLVGIAAGIPVIPAGTYLDQIMDDGTAVYDRTTDSLQANRDRGDTAWITATGFSTHSAANVWAVATRQLTGTQTFNLTGNITGNLSGSVGSVSAGGITAASFAANAVDANALAADAVDEIVTDILVTPAQKIVTDANGFVTANLNGDLTATMKASVNTEVDTALVDIDLDHLIEVTAGAEEPTDGSYLDQIMHKDGGQTFDATTDSLEAIRDTTPLGTAMRGTDSAALASVCTEARLSELDAANLPTTTDNIEIDTQDIQTRVPATLVSGRMSSDAVAISGSTDASDKLEASAETIVIGTIDTTVFPATTVEFETDDITEATADHFNGRIVIFTSGSLLYQATDITDYVLTAGRGHFTITALTEAPGNNDTFVIV